MSCSICCKLRDIVYLFTVPILRQELKQLSDVILTQNGNIKKIYYFSQFTKILKEIVYFFSPEIYFYFLLSKSFRFISMSFFEILMYQNSAKNTQKMVKLFYGTPGVYKKTTASRNRLQTSRLKG